MVGEDQGFAAVPLPVDDAATGGCDVVIAWVAGGEQRGVGVDQESDAGFELDRRGEEDVAAAVWFQLNGFSGGAVVDGGLDSGGVE